MKSFIQTIVLTIVLFIAVPMMRLHAQWNTNTSENIMISGLVDADQQTVATSDGKMWVAFYNQTSGNYDMRAQLIDAEGHKLLGNDGVLVSNYPSGSAIFVFNVCVDASDNLVIGCQDERTGAMKAVLFKISQTGAHLWDPAGVVLGEGLAPNPALLSNGEIVVVWNENASNTLQLQKVNAGGTLAWANSIPVTVGSTKTTRGQPIGNTGGKFTLVYQKMAAGVATTLYAQMFDNAGTALYAPKQIGVLTTSAARYYSLAAEEDTTYFGYYASIGFRFNSFLQRINPDGTTPWGMNGSNFSTATSSSDDYQGPTNIGLAPGSPYVWSVCTYSDPNQTKYGIYIQKFTKAGGARQFTDLAKVVYPIGVARHQQEGELIISGDNPIFMFYDNVYRIYATRLDASGNFAWPGNQLELSSTTSAQTSQKGRFGFSSDGPNRCAGVWVENRGEGFLGYAQGVSVGGVIGIDVATQGGAPAVITTQGGTLPMVSTVYPAGANQAVVWSITPGTGQATISAAGVVTASGNGTVWARASAVQDPTVADSLMITISNQIPSGTADKMSPAETITLFPNPTGGLVTIHCAGIGAGNYTLRIFNALGEQVNQPEIISLQTGVKKQLDLRYLKPGIWFIEFSNGAFTVVRKLIVER